MAGLCLEITHSVTREFGMDEAVSSPAPLENFMMLSDNGLEKGIKDKRFQVENPITSL